MHTCSNVFPHDQGIDIGHECAVAAIFAGWHGLICLVQPINAPIAARNKAIKAGGDEHRALGYHGDFFIGAWRLTGEPPSNSSVDEVPMAASGRGFTARKSLYLAIMNPRQQEHGRDGAN